MKQINSKVYVASCTEDGGIYQYSIGEDYKFELINKTPLDRPMYMTAENNKMYIILRQPFDNSESGVISYDIEENGCLKNPSVPLSTQGVVACHILVDEGEIYCANYLSGSAIKLPEHLVVHKGIGPNLPRQDAPHVHYVGSTPDKKYICVVDLGLDTIFLYTRDMQLHSYGKVPSGHGARHIIFSDDGRYMFCANELKSTVSAFRYTDGELTLLDTVRLLPEDFKEKSTAAAIRIKHGLIYVSNRGYDSVSEIRFDGEKLELIRNISCGGKSPRDFDFIDNLMICTNEVSDNITVFDCENDFKQVGDYPVKSPLCVMFKK